MLQIRDKCLVPLNYLQKLYVLIGVDIPATQFFHQMEQTNCVVVINLLNLCTLTDF